MIGLKLLQQFEIAQLVEYCICTLKSCGFILSSHSTIWNVCMNRPVLSLGWTSEQDVCQSCKLESLFWSELLWWISWGLQSWQTCYFASLSIGSFSNLIAQTLADLPWGLRTQFSFLWFPEKKDRILGSLHLTFGRWIRQQLYRFVLVWKSRVWLYYGHLEEILPEKQGCFCWNTV